MSRLRDAAESIATAWFQIRGFEIDEPRKPTTYDLVVRKGDLVKTVQVKTTTYRDNGNWLVNIGRRPSNVSKSVSRLAYVNGTVDWFFIIDGDLAIYLVPASEVAGQVTMTLSHYQDYRVGSAASLAIQL